MTTWTKDELDRIEHADEPATAPRHVPGTPHAPATIRGVRDSAALRAPARPGRGAAWSLAARAGRASRIGAESGERDITIVEADGPAVSGRLDAACGAYPRHSADRTGPLVAGAARVATLGRVPR
ncbi:DUF2255 family protein [Streptomyces sp. ME01-24h]|nr:DUF2255 family protein [Streptomyces sp. ME19-03-3]MDX3357105.1 DUF2255 family protein [Streptomyces sp. ME01-24h]